MRIIIKQFLPATKRARGADNYMSRPSAGPVLRRPQFPGSKIDSAEARVGKPALAIMIPLAFLLTFIVSGAGAMTEMRDAELSNVSGQALMQMGKTETGGLAFYKAGLDAEVELNMNIEKLQLGCTGNAINGQHCDIDIDRLGLSGSTWGADGRPSSAAVLTRPFFEFAIKNDGSKTLREVVGIRLSAERASGMMTFGDQQAGASDPGNTSGINSLSGYMQIGSATGVAQTEARQMCYATGQCTDGSVGLSTGGVGQAARMMGRIRANTDILGWATGDFWSDTYRLNLDEANANIVTNPTTVNGKRQTFVDLLGTATIDDINFAGQMTANATLLGIGFELDKEVTGTIRGLTATVPIQESLKFIHKINVNNPFSLSMQREDVLWPGAAAPAMSGWWLAFEDEIDIGNISPEAKVPLTNQVLLQALTGASGPPWSTNNAGVSGSPQLCQVPSINCSLYRRLSTGTSAAQTYGVTCPSLSDCLGGDSLPVGLMTVPANVNFPLNDLKLGAQSVTPNCYGSARFC